MDKECRAKFSYEFSLHLPMSLPQDEQSLINLEKLFIDYLKDIENVKLNPNANTKLENLKFELGLEGLNKIYVTGECENINENLERMRFCHSSMDRIVEEINLNELMMRINDFNIESAVNEELPEPTMPELYEYSTTDESYFDHSVDQTTSNFVLPFSTTPSPPETSHESKNTYHEIYDSVKNDFDDEYYNMPSIDLYPQLITQINRNSTLFLVQAVISVKWNDNFSDINSEMFMRFSSSFSKYAEAVYEMDPLINGTIIACKVKKIAKDFFMKYDKLEFNENDVILDFILETVGFSITNENDLNLGEGNIFDEIFKNFKIKEFLEIFGEKNEILEEFDYDYDDENISEESKEIKDDEERSVNETKAIEDSEINFYEETKDTFENQEEKNAEIFTSDKTNESKNNEEFESQNDKDNMNISKIFDNDEINSKNINNQVESMKNDKSSENISQNDNQHFSNESSNILFKNEYESNQSNENTEPDSNYLQTSESKPEKIENILPKINIEFENKQIDKTINSSKNEHKHIKIDEIKEQEERNLDINENESKEKILNSLGAGNFNNNQINNIKIINHKKTNMHSDKNIPMPLQNNHYASKTIRMDSRGMRTVQYLHDGLVITNMDSHGIQTYIFNHYGLKTIIMDSNGIKTTNSDGNGLRVMRNANNEFILVNSEGYEVDLNDFEYELMKFNHNVPERTQFKQNDEETVGTGSKNLFLNNKEESQENFNENDINKKAQTKEKDYNEISNELTDSYDYESEESTEEKKSKKSFEEVQVEEENSNETDEITETYQNFEENYSIDKDVKSQHKIQDFSTLSDDEDYNEIKLKTIVIKDEILEPNSIDIIPKTNDVNHNFIIEAFEAYKIEGNAKNFICKKCKIKINTNNDIEILTDDHNSNQIEKNEKENTASTEQQVTNKNEFNNKSNKIKHKYIWRYFMRLYAENEFDHSERVICEKCEVKMKPDGKFEIFEEEKLAVNEIIAKSFKIQPSMNISKIRRAFEKSQEIFHYSEVDSEATTKYPKLLNKTKSFKPIDSINNDYQNNDSQWEKNELNTVEDKKIYKEYLAINGNKDERKLSMFLIGFSFFFYFSYFLSKM